MANKKHKPPSHDTDHHQWLVAVPEDWELLVDLQDDDVLSDNFTVTQGRPMRKGKRFDPDSSDY